jgi:two-component system response regulator FlrC
MKPILVAEDNAALAEALCATLRVAGFEVVHAIDGRRAIEMAATCDPILVLSDVQMQPLDGYALLGHLVRNSPATPVVLMTAFADVSRAVQAMREGAADYLVKPFDAERLLQVVRRCLPASAADDDGVVAVDPATQQLLALARKVAATPATVLIAGESGSGKEIVARYVHRHSPRAAGPFVAINCAAIPEQLLEATLFGHEKGAYTGAARSEAGKFEQAQGGTLLLDEVSEMPVALQAKLLRVLQEREVERVGGRRTIALDVRVIATTNRVLHDEVAQGRFREDLYYRLNVFPLEVPPLRDRPGDVVPLAEAFLQRAAAESGGSPAVLHARAKAYLTAYDWPGNVRELANAVQRALIVAPGAIIDEEHLRRPRQAARAEAAVPAPGNIRSAERDLILKTLAAVNGSRRRAVERLGISERTLRYKLQQYRLAGAL